MTYSDTQRHLEIAVSRGELLVLVGIPILSADAERVTAAEGDGTVERAQVEGGLLGRHRVVLRLLGFLVCGTGAGGTRGRRYRR